MNGKRLVVGFVLAAAVAGCSSPASPPSAPAGGAAAVTAEQARAVAKEAFLYGFPLVTNYATLHTQAVDTSSRDYRGPFNVLGRSKSVATPDDKFVVTPNSDTPYSFLWADLRAEPVVITMPAVEKDRYYSAQLIDLYTFNFAYLGTREKGNGGGTYLLAGPRWTGTAPPGIDVIRSETDIVYVLFRTQLFNEADLPNVIKVQAAYDAKPLSAHTGQPAPPPAPAIAWAPPTKEMTTTPALFPVLNFLLQFAPTHPSEKELMARFGTLNIGAGKTFELSSFTPDVQAAITQGIADAQADFEGVQKGINAEKISSADMFGTRDALKNNYLYRYTGARLGLYGNSAAEAIYLAYFVDATGKPADASARKFTLTFAKDQLPPARAFWSLTMYDGKTQLLVANPINRYLLNSTTLKSYVYGPDGSLTLYVQKDSPGGRLTANWLPAPDGPFYAILRIYLPEPRVIDGSWKKPPLQPVP